MSFPWDARVPVSTVRRRQAEMKDKGRGGIM
jgi:hypothetical protein